MKVHHFEDKPDHRKFQIIKRSLEYKTWIVTNDQMLRMQKNIAHKSNSRSRRRPAFHTLEAKTQEFFTLMDAYLSSFKLQFNDCSPFKQMILTKAKVS